VPFNLGFPPHATPFTPGGGPVYQPVATNIIAIWDNAMMSCGVLVNGGIMNIKIENKRQGPSYLFFGNTTQFSRILMIRDKYQAIKHTPKTRLLYWLVSHSVSKP
jgi:hypothetical protein